MALRAKKQGNRNCFSYPTCVYAVIMWLICALFSFSAIFFYCVFSYCVFSYCVFSYCVFSPVSPLLFCSLFYVLALSFVVNAVFFADLPIFLPSVGLSLFLCVIIRLGVFRGFEAKKSGFVLWLGGIYTEKGRTRLL